MGLADADAALGGAEGRRLEPQRLQRREELARAVADTAGALAQRSGHLPIPAGRRTGRAVLEPETNYHETVGLLYHDALLGPLVVVASSVDEDSRQQLRELRQLLILGLLVSVTAAYAFSRFRFVGRKLIMLQFLLINMFPIVLLILPLFILMRKLNLLDTHFALIMANATVAIPFAIWMLTSYVGAIVAMRVGEDPQAVIGRVKARLLSLAPALAVDQLTAHNTH